MSSEKGDEAKTAHIDKAIGLRLRDYRKALGLTRRHVAEVLDVSVGSIQHYEEGERIPASRLWQFCGHYGVAVEDLFQGLPHHVGPEAPAPAELAEGSQEGGEAQAAYPNVAQSGGVFEGPVEDAIIRAIRDELVRLNSVERSVILRAVRGVGIKTRKTP